MFELKVNDIMKIEFDSKESAVKSASWYARKGFDVVVIDVLNRSAIHVSVA